jgi:hypothetical protein
MDAHCHYPRWSISAAACSSQFGMTNSRYIAAERRRHGEAERACYKPPAFQKKRRPETGKHYDVYRAVDLLFGLRGEFPENGSFL